MTATQRETERKPKRKKVSQRFRHECSVTWPCVKPSRKGNLFAYCEVCRKDLSIQGGGGNDIHVGPLGAHGSRPSYMKCESAQRMSGSITNFTNPETAVTKNISKAGLLFTDFLIEHNIALAASDHSNELFNKDVKQ